MRIVQVVNVRWNNATAWYALHLSALLKQAGHDVVVFCLEGTRPHEIALELGLRVVSLDINTTNPLKIFPLFLKLWRFIDFYRPDIVNCHRGEGFILWGLLKLAKRSFKLVRTRGDQRLPQNNAINRWLHNVVADAIIATNSRMANHFLHALGTPKDKLWIVYGGVDQEHFSPTPLGRESVRKEFGFGPDKVVIGIVGRFDHVKGHLQLIKAVSELYHQQKHHDIYLFIIGFEAVLTQKHIEDLLSKYEITHITRISGIRNDIADCISALDISVIPSISSETIARAAFELLSCNVPVISSKTGVLPDIFDERQLFDQDAPNSLIEILESFIVDSEMRSAVLKGQSEKKHNFSEHEFLRQTLTIYYGI